MDLSLHVGPTAYAVVLADRSIFDAEGNELEGVAVEGRRMIILSRTVEPERREEVCEHEFFHCWLFHVPTPANEEEAAQLHSLVARQFRHDVEAVGGPDIFYNLRHRAIQIGRPARIEQAMALSHRQFSMPSDRMSCATCDATIMCGSIHTSSPTSHEGTGRHHVERWMQCDSCGAVQVWYEVASADGLPLGEFCAVPAPKILRGAIASAWIAERAELVG